MKRGGSGEPSLPGLLTTALCLAFLRCAVVILGYARTRRLAQWFSKAPRQEPMSPGPQLKLAHAVAAQVSLVAAVLPGRAMCLEQSLALYTLLRRRGLAPQLVLAVQPYPFVAHCWVEVDGTPINETEARIGHFEPLRAG